MSEAFDAAVARVSDLSEDPGNDVKLSLYALFKQATQGDVSGKRPASRIRWAEPSTTHGQRFPG